MAELTHVISSTPLDGETPPLTICPRQLLGRTCIAEEYECLCEHVEQTTVEVVKRPDGGSTLRLFMTLNRSGDANLVVSGIEMSGLTAHVGGSYRHVEASFDLFTPQNADLKTLYV